MLFHSAPPFILYYYVSALYARHGRKKCRGEKAPAILAIRSLLQMKENCGLVNKRKTTKPHKQKARGLQESNKTQSRLPEQ
jgi:hypothetical protein